MNKELQRIEIAKFCGHKDVVVRYIGHEECCGFYDVCSGICGEGGYTVPDYPNDLNAMHEAVKIFSESQEDDFYTILWGITAIPNTPHSHFRAANATASQRAEAFLRTLNLWKE